MLGGRNVAGIYTLAPMTQLQTAANHPDMTAIEYILQFALLNRDTVQVDRDGTTYTANSYALDAAYAPGSVPDGVAVPPTYCPDCTGLDFKNTGGDNDALASSVIDKGVPGDYMF